MYKNILILNLRKIGDTIMATSAAYLLKKAYPQAKITMLVKPLTRPIVENNPVIDEVMLYNYEHKVNLSDLKQTVNQLKEKHFDLAVVIDGKARSAVLAYLAGIPKRAGFENITLRNIYLKIFYTDLFNIGYDAFEVQQVKNHENFINRLTGKKDKAQMVMPDVDKSGQAKVKSLLQQLPQDKLKIALCLRSNCEFKDWPMQYFVETVQKLNEKYSASFFIVGAKNDKKFADSFIYKADLKNVYDFCGQTTLPQLGYLLKQADFMLSVDTGTAHIAASQHTPEVVIFAGTSHKHWAPYGSCVDVVYPNIPCYPCSDKMRRQCRKKADRYDCLNKVYVQDVIDKCSAKLDKLEEKYV